MSLRRLFGVAAAAFGCVSAQSPSAHAQVTRLEITNRETPVSNGQAFGPAGAYERLQG